MSDKITGSFSPRLRKHWVVSSYDLSQCDVMTSCGRRFVLAYRGDGGSRVYFITDDTGSVLAQSRRIYTSGWRSFVNQSLMFTDPTGKDIMEYSGRLFPTTVRFGSVEVTCRRYVRKWFRQVFDSEFFEFERKASKAEVSFIIKDPRFFLPSLCCGYLDYVLQSENNSAGG